MRTIGLAVLGLILLVNSMEAADTASATEPAITAINAAIESLKNQPNQFNLKVIAVGAVGVGSGGGTGINVHAQGGGPGSHTTGLVATADGKQITIAQETADATLKEQSQKAIALLEEIRQELQTAKPDRDTILSQLSRLAETYVAPVLTAIIEALVRKRLGL